MAISSADFVKAKPGDSPYNLANIADFNSLIAQSQKFNVPVFALTDAQIEQKGQVLQNMAESGDNFKTTFKNLATCVRSLVGI